MPRMRTLLPARKVLVASVAAGTASLAAAHFGGHGLGVDASAVTVALAAFAGGWLTPPAPADCIETPPPRPTRRQATGIFLAS